MMNIKLERANGNHMRSNVSFDNFDDEMFCIFICLIVCISVYVCLLMYVCVCVCILYLRFPFLCGERIPCVCICLSMSVYVSLCVSKCIVCEKIVSIMYISFHWIESVSNWYTKSSSFSCSQVEINQKQNNNKKTKRTRIVRPAP